MTESAGLDTRPRVTRRDQLVRWSLAAEELGVSEDSLVAWHKAGHMPAVRTPGLLCTYRSWLDAVMCSARPGKAGDIREVSRQWWEAHLPGEALEVA